MRPLLSSTSRPRLILEYANLARVWKRLDIEAMLRHMAEVMGDTAMHLQCSSNSFQIIPFWNSHPSASPRLAKAHQSLTEQNSRRLCLLR